MKSLFNKLYFMLMGPLYSRLSRDISLRMQELARVQVEFQEKWAVTMSDEIIALSMQAGGRGDALQNSPREYTMYEIIDIAGRIQKSGDLVMLSEQLSIPLDELAGMYMKYGHINRAGIARLMELEQQVKDLSHLLTPGTVSNFATNPQSGEFPKRIQAGNGGHLTSPIVSAGENNSG